MLFCGCYHEYVIGPVQYLVPFRVTRKNNFGWLCMPYTRAQLYDGLFGTVTKRSIFYFNVGLY